MRQFAVQVVGSGGEIRVPHVSGDTKKIRGGYYNFHFDQPLQLVIGDSLNITCLDDSRKQCLGISRPTTLLGVNLPVDTEGEVRLFHA